MQFALFYACGIRHMTHHFAFYTSLLRDYIIISIIFWDHDVDVLDLTCPLPVFCLSLPPPLPVFPAPASPPVALPQVARYITVVVTHFVYVFNKVVMLVYSFRMMLLHRNM